MASTTAATISEEGPAPGARPGKLLPFSSSVQDLAAPGYSKRKQQADFIVARVGTERHSSGRPLSMYGGDIMDLLSMAPGEATAAEEEPQGLQSMAYALGVGPVEDGGGDAPNKKSWWRCWCC